MAVGQSGVPAIIELQKLNPSKQENEEKTGRMVEHAQDLIQSLLEAEWRGNEALEARNEIREAVEALMLAVVSFLPDTPGRSRILNQCISVKLEADMVIANGGNY